MRCAITFERLRWRMILHYPHLDNTFQSSPQASFSFSSTSHNLVFEILYSFYLSLFLPIFVFSSSSVSNILSIYSLSSPSFLLFLFFSYSPIATYPIQCGLPLPLSFTCRHQYRCQAISPCVRHQYSNTNPTREQHN